MPFFFFLTFGPFYMPASLTFQLCFCWNSPGTANCSSKTLSCSPFWNTPVSLFSSKPAHSFCASRPGITLKFFQDPHVIYLFLLYFLLLRLLIVFTLATWYNRILYQVVPCVVFVFLLLNYELFDGRHVVSYFFHPYLCWKRTVLKLGNQ